MKLLNEYLNGNVTVEIYSDGTKKRAFAGKPFPIHPESIDVKITDFCDAKCSYCHEKSTMLGEHGDLGKLKEVLQPLPPGVELAIGGGNPLSHPDLIPFLIWCKEKGLIANITVNQKHIEQYQTLILDLIEKDLIKGLGISYSSENYLKFISSLLQKTNNLVFHVIMGINSVEDIEKLHDFCNEQNKVCKILILGYKHFGFGINYYLRNLKIEDNKYQWYTQLFNYFKEEDLILSFDNLGIEQLNLQRFFTKESWETFYMGDDFTFTMYIDAVKQEFAHSSTSLNRVSFSEISLFDYFQNKA